MKLVILIIAVFVVTVAPAICVSVTTLVLKYSDLGPQVIAWETIGMEWWQWESHGGPDPTTVVPIKVVVYRGISLSEVKRLYPVDKERKQDYRYLSYRQAIEYLNRNIKENVLSSVTERLRKTKQIVIDELGKP